MIKSLITRKFLLATAIVILATGMAISFTAIPQSPADIDYALLALVFVATVPITLALGTLRFRLISGAAGAPLPISKCFEVIVMGTVANFLPIPGAFLVRMHALRHHGLQKSASSNLIATTIWLGVSSIIAGIGVLFIGSHKLTWAFIALAAISLVSSFAIARLSHLNITQIPSLLVTQIAISLIDIIRMWVIGQGLATDIGLAGAAILGFSGIVGSMSGVLPAGIGVTESIAALLAKIFEMSPAIGFLIAALNRLLILIGILLAAIILMRIAENDQLNTSK